MLHKSIWKILRTDKTVLILSSSMFHIPFNICEKLDISMSGKEPNISESFKGFSSSSAWYVRHRLWLHSQKFPGQSWNIIKLNYNIELAKKFIQIFHVSLLKNSNSLANPIQRAFTVKKENDRIFSFLCRFP